jgi:type IV secretory pathway VirB3-like protein
VLIKKGTSTGASALSHYIDALTDFRISQSMRAAMPINISGFAPYPDFLAFGLAIIITSMCVAFHSFIPLHFFFDLIYINNFSFFEVLLVVGVRESSFLNIIFTGANLAVVIFIVIVGTIKSDPTNWQLDVYVKLFGHI